MPYKFPPINGLGNPANPWSFNIVGAPIVLDGHRNMALLLEVNVKDIESSLTFDAYGPGGGVLDSVPEWGWVGTIVTLYPAATTARSTDNDDTPAATFVPDLMEPTLNFGRMLFVGADPLEIAQPAAGIIDLIDPSGDLDELLDRIWDGAKIIIKRGHVNLPFNTYGEVGRFTGSTIIGNQDKKTIRLRDLAWRLGANLHDEYYDGSGGLGGDPALAGVWKPYTVGWCFNVEPIAVNGTAQIFQWSFTPSEEVMELRHGGSVLTNTLGDFDTYEELLAAAVPSGQYATCLAHSLVKINVTLNFGIRVDVKGDNSSQSGFPTPLTRAAIARRIATAYGFNHALDPDTEIDINAFQEVDNAHAATLGYHWKQVISKAQALSEVMSGIMGWWHVRPNGLLSIGFAREPTAVQSLQDIEFQTNGMGLINIVDATIPRQGTLIGWRKNYGPQAKGQLAGSVPEDTATIYGNDSRFAQVTDASVISIYPTAQVATLNGGYWLEVDALAEALRQQALMSVPRRRYRWTMEIDPFADMINRVMTLTNVNKLGFGSSKPLLCVGMDTPGFGETVTEWWG